MPIITILYGLLLVGLGVGGYYASADPYWTAWIPALFGVALIASGVLARRESLYKHAMHAASTLGLLAFLVSMHGLWHLPKVLDGTESGSAERVGSEAVMALASLLFVALCVKSFIDARRARAGA